MLTIKISESKTGMKLGDIILLHLILAVQDMLDEGTSDMDMSLY
jgi:hypothetical protein